MSKISHLVLVFSLVAFRRVRQKRSWNYDESIKLRNSMAFCLL